MRSGGGGESNHQTSYSEWQKRPVPTFRPGSKGSLQEIMDKAPPYSRVIVLGGIYNEQLVITKPIELIGEEGEDPVLIHKGPVVSVHNEVECFIQRLTIQAKASPNKAATQTQKDAPAVLIGGTSKPVFKNCDITSVMVTATSDPQFAMCTIGKNTNGPCITVRDHSSGTYSQCKFRECSTYCVEVCSRGEPRFVDNTIEADTKDPVAAGQGLLHIFGGKEVRPVFSQNRFEDLMDANAVPRYVNTVMYSSRRSAVIIDGFSEPVFEDNMFIGSEIMITLRACAGSFKNNTVTSARSCGMYLRAGCGMLLQENKIQGNAAYGIVLDGADMGILDGNHIANNSHTGMLLLHSTGFQITNNHFVSNAGGGLCVWEHAKGYISENDFRMNQRFGAYFYGTDCAVTFKQNRLLNNAPTGLICEAGCAPEISQNEIASSPVTGVWITTSANPKLEKNVVSDCTRYGVIVTANGRGILTRNTIKGGREASLFVTDGANPRVSENDIAEGSLCGIMVSEGGIGDFIGNRIRNCAFGAVVRLYADPVFHNNVVLNCGEAGFVSEEEGVGTFVSNTIERCSQGFIVDRGGEGTFRNNSVKECTAAGALLKEGSRCILEKNQFDANAAGIYIRGEDSEPTVRLNTIQNSTTFGIMSSEKGAGQVYNNKIMQSGSAALASIDGGMTLFRNNRCLHDKGHGILCTSTGMSVFRDNEIDGSSGSGVMVGRGGKPDIADCKFLNCKIAGIEIGDASDGSITKCEVSSCEVGLRARGHCKCAVSHVTFDANNQFGAQLDEEAEATLLKCKFTNHPRIGVAIRNAGASLLQECEFLDNVCDVESTLAGSNTTLKKCRLAGGDSSQVHVDFHSNGDARLDDCVIIDGKVGVRFRDRGRGVMKDTHISRVSGPGITFENLALGSVSNCSIEGCDIGCSCSGPESRGTVQDTIFDHNGCNVLVTEKSGTEFTRCNILKASKRAGVECERGAAGAFLNCRIYENDHGGVSCFGIRTRTSFTDCHIYYNGMFGVEGGDRAECVFTNNNIEDNKGAGVIYGHHAKLNFAEKNIVFRNGFYGVLCEDGADGIFSHNTVHGHTSTANVKLDPGAQTRFERNTISDGRVGIINEGSNCTLLMNKINKHKQCAIQNYAKSTCLFDHNEIFENRTAVSFHVSFDFGDYQNEFLSKNAESVFGKSGGGKKVELASDQTLKRQLTMSRLQKDGLAQAGGLIARTELRRKTVVKFDGEKKKEGEEKKDDDHDDHESMSKLARRESTLAQEVSVSQLEVDQSFSKFVETEKEKLAMNHRYERQRRPDAAQAITSEPSSATFKNNNFHKNGDHYSFSHNSSSSSRQQQDSPSASFRKRVQILGGADDQDENQKEQEEGESSSSSSSSATAAASGGGSGGGGGGGTSSLTMFNHATEDMYPSVTLSTFSNAVFYQNTFKNESKAIVILDDARGSVEENEFSNNEIGVSVEASSCSTVIAHNDFKANKIAIELALIQSPTFCIANNVVSDSVIVGLLARAGSSGTISSFEFKGGACGMRLQDKSNVTVSDCVFSSCSDTGLIVETAAAPTISRCRFDGTCSFGIRLNECQAAVAACVFVNCTHAGLVLENPLCQSKVSKCLFTQNNSSEGSVGVLFRNRSAGEVSFCDFHENSYAVRTEEQADGFLNQCLIHRQTIGGVHATTNASTRFRKCSFAQNTGADILTNSQARPEIQRCLFRGDAHAGIKCNGGGCIATDCAFRGYTEAAIHFVAGHNASIQKCFFTSNDCAVLSTGKAPGQGCDFVSNIVSNCRYGVRLHMGVGVKINHCIISQCEMQAVEIRALGTGCTLSSNHFYKCAGGIRVNEVQVQTVDAPTSINNNIITEMGTMNGIELAGGVVDKTFVIQENNISGCRYGMNFFDGSARVIRNQISACDQGMLIQKNNNGYFEGNVTHSCNRVGTLIYSQLAEVTRNFFCATGESGALEVRDPQGTSTSRQSGNIKANDVKNNYVPHWAKVPALPVNDFVSVTDVKLSKEDNATMSVLRKMYADEELFPGPECLCDLVAPIAPTAKAFSPVSLVSRAARAAEEKRRKEAVDSRSEAQKKEEEEKFKHQLLSQYRLGSGGENTSGENSNPATPISAKDKLKSSVHKIKNASRVGLPTSSSSSSKPSSPGASLRRRHTVFSGNSSLNNASTSASANASPRSGSLSGTLSNRGKSFVRGAGKDQNNNNTNSNSNSLESSMNNKRTVSARFPSHTQQRQKEKEQGVEDRKKQQQAIALHQALQNQQEEEQEQQQQQDEEEEEGEKHVLDDENVHKLVEVPAEDSIMIDKSQVGEIGEYSVDFKRAFSGGFEQQEGKNEQEQSGRESYSVLSVHSASSTSSSAAGGAVGPSGETSSSSPTTRPSTTSSTAAQEKPPHHHSREQQEQQQQQQQQRQQRPASSGQESTGSSNNSQRRKSVQFQDQQQQQQQQQQNQTSVVASQIVAHNDYINLEDQRLREEQRRIQQLYQTLTERNKLQQQQQNEQNQQAQFDLQRQAQELEQQRRRLQQQVLHPQYQQKSVGLVMMNQHQEQQNQQYQTQEEAEAAVLAAAMYHRENSPRAIAGRDYGGLRNAPTNKRGGGGGGQHHLHVLNVGGSGEPDQSQNNNVPAFVKLAHSQDISQQQNQVSYQEQQSEQVKELLGPSQQLPATSKLHLHRIDMSLGGSEQQNQNNNQHHDNVRHQNALLLAQAQKNQEQEQQQQAEEELSSIQQQYQMILLRKQQNQQIESSPQVAINALQHSVFAQEQLIRSRIRDSSTVKRQIKPKISYFLGKDANQEVDASTDRIASTLTLPPDPRHEIDGEEPDDEKDDNNKKKKNKNMTMTTFEHENKSKDKKNLSNKKISHLIQQNRNRDAVEAIMPTQEEEDEAPVGESFQVTSLTRRYGLPEDGDDVPVLPASKPHVSPAAEIGAFDQDDNNDNNNYQNIPQQQQEEEGEGENETVQDPDLESPSSNNKSSKKKKNEQGEEAEEEEEEVEETVHGLFAYDSRKETNTQDRTGKKVPDRRPSPQKVTESTGTRFAHVAQDTSEQVILHEIEEAEKKLLSPVPPSSHSHSSSVRSPHVPTSYNKAQRILDKMKEYESSMGVSTSNRASTTFHLPSQNNNIEADEKIIKKQYSIFGDTSPSIPNLVPSLSSSSSSSAVAANENNNNDSSRALTARGTNNNSSNTNNLVEQEQQQDDENHTARPHHHHRHHQRHQPSVPFVETRERTHWEGALAYGPYSKREARVKQEREKRRKKNMNEKQKLKEEDHEKSHEEKEEGRRIAALRVGGLVGDSPICSGLVSTGITGRTRRRRNSPDNNNSPNKTKTSSPIPPSGGKVITSAVRNIQQQQQQREKEEEENPQQDLSLLVMAPSLLDQMQQGRIYFDNNNNNYSTSGTTSQQQQNKKQQQQLVPIQPFNASLQSLNSSSRQQIREMMVQNPVSTVHYYNDVSTANHNASLAANTNVDGSSSSDPLTPVWTPPRFLVAGHATEAQQVLLDIKSHQHQQQQQQKKKNENKNNNNLHSSSGSGSGGAGGGLSSTANAADVRNQNKYNSTNKKKLAANKMPSGKTIAMQAAQFMRDHEVKKSDLRAATTAQMFSSFDRVAGALGKIEESPSSS